LNWNWVEEKWDANWWKKYWKYVCEYAVEKKNLKIDANPKIHLLVAIYSGMG
jgi:hypothetical protein